MQRADGPRINLPFNHFTQLHRLKDVLATLHLLERENGAVLSWFFLDQTGWKEWFMHAGKERKTCTNESESNLVNEIIHLTVNLIVSACVSLGFVFVCVA